MIVNNQKRILTGLTLLKDLVLTNYYKEDISSVPKIFKTGVSSLYSKRDMKSTTGYDSNRPLFDIMSNLKDFDADSFQPMGQTYSPGSTDGEEYEKGEETKFDPLVDTYETFDRYRRHLDGAHAIDSSYIFGYITMCLRRYEYANTAKYRKDNGTQVNMSGEADTILLEADLLATNTNEAVSPTNVNLMVQELAYRLKRLFKFGNMMHVSILSLLIAHAKAVQSRTDRQVEAQLHGKVRDYTITLNKCIDEGIYECGESGALGELFTIIQKSKRLIKVYDIYLGKLPKYASYTRDMSMVEHLCDKLGIDITTIDVTKFDYNFFASLQTNYLISDKDYFRTVEVKRTMNTAVALQEATETALRNVVQAFYENEFVLNYMKAYPDMKSKEARAKDVLYKFEKFNKKYLDGSIDMNDLYFENDILYTADGDVPMLFNSNGTFRNCAYGDAKCILCSNGLVFPITSSSLYMLDFEGFYYLYVEASNGRKLSTVEKEVWQRIL